MRVLFIAYYFPPMGGSGVQRPVKFARHLSPLGVETHFLVPEPPGYHVHDDSLLEQVPHAAERVHRVKGATPLDLPAAGALSRFYRRWMASAAGWLSPWIWLPDNKKGWIEPAFGKAVELLARLRFDLIYATAAPYSNLLLAARLGERTSLPVIMDLRDDWLDSHLIRYPTRWHYRRMRAMERQTLSQARAITVVNEGYRRALLERIPDSPDITVIPNGFDHDDFAISSPPDRPAATPATVTPTTVAVSTTPAATRRPASGSGGAFEEGPGGTVLATGRFTLLHNGLFYGRQQPDALLHAVAGALERRPSMRRDLCVVFQGDFFDRHRVLASRLGLDGLVESTGGLPHSESVRGLLRADALWLTVPEQPNAEHHTPGKLYEYFGSGKPILAFTSAGVAHELLTRYGASWIVPPSDGVAAQTALLEIHDAWLQGRMPTPDVKWASQFDRRELAARLHDVFLKVLDR